jgi:hypothetical protein
MLVLIRAEGKLRSKIDVKSLFSLDGMNFGNLPATKPEINYRADL